MSAETREPANTDARPDLLLGLIGDNIAKSRAPVLHRLAGEQNGMKVVYDRLIPKERGEDFDTLFANCRNGGYRGLNITYPYKERVVPLVSIEDPLVQAVGAVNTVIFAPEGPRGHNTDYSGFVAAYRGVRGDTNPGAVCLIGTGGVGRAVAFGLVALGCGEIRLVDRDLAKAEAMAADLRKAAAGMTVTVSGSAEDAAKGAQGMVNCTPVGMVGYEGTPLPRASMTGAEWAFDAVYTPVDTQFLQDAAAEGLAVVSGYELFIYQGVHAWELFSGKSLDEARLRADLADGTA
jgi:shikimate dehydrogenase